ncbi:SRPBCC domain-containing protein, partial [Acinetobacter baumannii]
MADRHGYETAPVTVADVQPLARLAYDWNGDLLVWSLEPVLTGTRLTLHHTVRAHDWLPKVAAGWDLCLEVME